jgi:peptidoglycan hydrolase-like protein with peptidoglycan-binding domain
MTAEDVKALQEALNKLMNSGLKVDGIFGPLTRSAVKDFQAQSGILVDGVVGQKTSDALDVALSERGFGILEWFKSLFR